jgi:hypothetical protein
MPMKKIIFIIAILGFATIAYAQQSQWLWFGTSQQTAVPVSASNPLPVKVTGQSLIYGVGVPLGGLQ